MSQEADIPIGWLLRGEFGGTPVRLSGTIMALDLNLMNGRGAPLRSTQFDIGHVLFTVDNHTYIQFLYLVFVLMIILSFVTIVEQGKFVHTMNSVTYFARQICVSFWHMYGTVVDQVRL